ncbi:MAG TPA: hypothetical protein VEH50_01385 [Methylomirabilota bacterium]|nr:hypothetical protein [Methylomirabilota bacterium]
MKPLPNDWRTIAAAGAALAAAVGSAIAWKYRHRPDPEEIERKRRAYINQVGRIAEGRVTELVDVAPQTQSVTRFGILGPRTHKIPTRSKSGRRLVCYSYSISGVTYETAQDITSLEARGLVKRLVAGQLTSVKYDPANPTNSILVTDDWSGIP